MPIRITRNVKPDFTDGRGEIIKLLDDGKTSIKSVLLIKSKKGAIRANHYHKEDAHYVYMVYGSMEYTEQPVGSGKKEAVVVKEGDLIYTPPMVEHAMHFLEDSAFLALAIKSRHHDAYESDTVRVKLI